MRWIEWNVLFVDKCYELWIMNEFNECHVITGHRPIAGQEKFKNKIIVLDCLIDMRKYWCEKSVISVAWTNTTQNVHWEP